MRPSGGQYNKGTCHFSHLTKYACRQIFSTLGGSKLPQCPMSHLSYITSPQTKSINARVAAENGRFPPVLTETPAMSNFSFELQNKLGPLVANCTVRLAIFPDLTKYVYRQIFSTLGGPKLPQCSISHLSYKINSTPWWPISQWGMQFFPVWQNMSTEKFSAP